MDKNFNFFEEENLYTSGQRVYNGKQYFKYVDFIVFEESKFCHIILIKINNYFTFKVANSMTDIPIEVAKKVLLLAQKIDYSSYSSVPKPDSSCFQRLYELINEKQTHYQDKNIVLNISTSPINYKSIDFTLTDKIPVLSMDVCISNLQTNIELTIAKNYYTSLRNLDRIFEIKANGQKAFFDLLCNKTAIKDDNYVNMSFITEKEFYLSTGKINKTLIRGTALWAFQLTNYLTNFSRDIPIDMKIDGYPIESNRLFVIFAIYGLKIQNDLRFGLVNFSNESGVDRIQTKEFKDLLVKEPDCYAQIAVFDNSFNNAINSAKTNILKAMNLLQILMLDDSPTFFFENLGDTLNEWEQSKLNCNLNIGDYFYVENVSSNINYAILSNKQESSEVSSNVSDNLFDLLNKDNTIENFFYLENKNKENLLQAIFLLNQSYKAIDKKQRIISLYNSIEFIVTGESGRKLEEELSAYKEFDKTKQDIKKIIENISEKSLKERMQGIIKGAFSGNSSVKSKLELLTQKIGLKMSVDDWELFDKLKNNRQKLIHNKKLSKEIYNQELDELYHLVSKIIIYCISYNVNKGDTK